MGSSPLRKGEGIPARSRRLLRTIAKLRAHILSPFEEMLDTSSRLHSFVTTAHGFHGQDTHRLTSST